MEFGVLELSVAGLAFLAVTLVGGGIALYMQGSRRELQRRMQGPDYDDQATFYADESANPFLMNAVASVGGAASGGKASSKLRKQMTQAGFTGPAAVQVFLGVKMMLLCFSLLVGLTVVLPLEMAPLQKGLLIFICAGLPFFIPNIVLDLCRRSRAREVQRNLPNMVDLLEICVSGGMGIDSAWNAVAEQTRSMSATLADEMALTDLEIHLGEERGVAVRHMADRTDSEDLSSLVAVLVQSERFGTSIADALVTFAASLREIRSQRAEEAAEKMAVTMLFPMIIFIFPVELIVAVGPAALKIVEIFSTT